MITSSSLSVVVDKCLPALIGSGVTYNSANNIFLTSGYTSAAGNTYYQGIRLSNRIIVSYDIGEGYYYSFLNGVKVYGFDGQEKRLIGSRSFSSTCYSEYTAKQAAISLVEEYMKSQCKMIGVSVDYDQINQFAKNLVVEAEKQTKLLN